MFYVPLYIELLRSRPNLVFWAAALAQAAIWILAPALFYFAPPGDLARLLAIGHEFRFDSGVGPPLAYWLGEIAFRIGGLFGVYVLAQICVVTTYWCVFTLGRALVGPAHAVMAVLLMVAALLIVMPPVPLVLALMASPPLVAMVALAPVVIEIRPAPVPAVTVMPLPLVLVSVVAAPGE